MKPLESLLKVFVQLHPEDAARAFETLDSEERHWLFKSLPSRIALALLQRISPHAGAEIVAQLEPAQAAKLLGRLPPRVASSVLHQVDPSNREALITALPQDVSRGLLALAQYAPETAGGMMEPRVVSLAADITVQEAISAIRQAPREALHYLYVTRRDGTLDGVINMRDLLLAKPRDPIAPIVRREVTRVPDVMSSSEVVDLMGQKRFLALPVVDFEGRLIGVVKQADALASSQAAAFENLQKIVGAGADERALSPVSMVVKSRLPWLFVNLVTAFMAAAVIGVFEGTIAKVAALAVLLPVVAGQGGNTGSQSLAVVMRGLALRELVPGSRKQLIYKELFGGLINGVAVAVVTAIAVFAWRMAAGDSVLAGSGLSLVIAMAMVVNMAAAAISGAVIPLILQKLGRDPAQSAAIFLTTVTDIVGFAAFLGFASLFMSWIV
ncbi:magnesium transporter [Planctomycetes bacterium TBK1r]|uniref:Magnesium transporter MgtE n=1 Tax=Stieleria magnilauensis TaxID=2527963 RepID=A0ABX5XTL0_9BACT|nr:Magnesium transporter MgtE [Planctomycetes bacterium TBK1r]